MVARDARFDSNRGRIAEGVAYSVYVGGGIGVAIDLLQYMKAGYVAQCHCKLEGALDWVSKEYLDEMKIRIADDSCTIEVEIAPDVWAPSGYYWEENTLFKKV